MDQLRETSDRPMSEIARRFAENPELAARCEAIAESIREAARADIEAGERSTQFTAKDLSVTVF